RGNGTGRAEGSAYLLAFLVDAERERAHRDHHRVPRADLHERLRSAARLDVHSDNQLVLGERVALRADEELRKREAPRAAHARDLDLSALDQQWRQSVAGRRRGAEVPADRPAVADL